MRRSVKFTLIGLIVIAILGAVPFALEPLVIRLGEHSIRELAREGKFCKTDHCDEGVSYAIGVLETNYGLSPQDIKWCMGVNVIAHHQLPFGNDLKKHLTDLMYRRCGDAPPGAAQPDSAPNSVGE